MRDTKALTAKNTTYIRATTDSAAHLSKLALSLFNANEEAHKVLGMNRPSIKVAIAYCESLAEPEFKRLAVKLSASNNLWRKIMQENYRIDKESKDAA